MARPIEEPEHGQDKSLTFTISFTDWKLLQGFIEDESQKTGYNITVSDMLRRIVRETVRCWRDRTPQL